MPNSLMKRFGMMWYIQAAQAQWQHPRSANFPNFNNVERVDNIFAVSERWSSLLKSVKNRQFSPGVYDMGPIRQQLTNENRVFHQRFLWGRATWGIRLRRPLPSKPHRSARNQWKSSFSVNVVLLGLAALYKEGWITNADGFRDGSNTVERFTNEVETFFPFFDSRVFGWTRQKP